MNPLHPSLRTLSFLLAALGIAFSAHAQQQTNDPLVGQQQYLFDVHRLDQAWSYTTGSSSTKVGVYSMLGFTQDHEDLPASRLASAQGLVVPELDYASEMVGILGAATDNSLGMAGIDRRAQLQSFGVLRSRSGGDDQASLVPIDLPDGTTRNYTLDVGRFADMVSYGRTRGVDVHLFSYGLPAARLADYISGSAGHLYDGLPADGLDPFQPR